MTVSLFAAAGMWMVVLAMASVSPAARQAPVRAERPSGPTIDFTVVDEGGTPVADLQSTEVEVRIGDRVRTVRALRRVSAAPPPAETGKPRLAPPYGTNADVAAGRQFAIVIDQESFAAGRENLFRAAADGLVAGMTPADRAMVALLPFGGVSLPFTSDKARIRLAIERVAGQGTRSETGSERACRTRRFLESFQGWLEQQPAGSAPLTVVLFTAGLAGPRRDSPMGTAPGMCELLVDQFRHVGTAAGVARANLYVMQPADVGLGVTLPRQTIGSTADLESANPLEGIEHLAGVTGAARLPLDERGGASLVRVARESSAYYVAEIEPQAGDLDRSRPLSIRVARKGVTVRARPEIRLLTPAAPATAARLAVTDLLSSPAAFPDLGLRVGGSTVRATDGSLRVGVVVEAVDPGVTLASAGAILIAGDGHVAAHWFAKSPSDRPLLGAMTVAPGTYRLRVAALDGEGRAGAAEDVVEAGLVAIGPISLGSLMLGVSRGGATAPQLRFSSEPTAIAYFDIYGGDAGLALSSRLEVARAADGPALLAVPLALARADATRVVATGTVPVGALPPGDYVVRGIVRLESGESGRILRTLRKAAP